MGGWGHLTLGRDTGTVVREAPAGRGVWLVAGALAPPRPAVPSLGSVNWRCGPVVSLPPGRVPVGSGGGGHRVEVGCG